MRFWSLSPNFTKKINPTLFTAFLKSNTIKKSLSFEINRNFKLKKTNKKHQPFDLQDKKVSKEVQKGRNECSTQRLRMICCISKVCVGGRGLCFTILKNLYEGDCQCLKYPIKLPVHSKPPILSTYQPLAPLHPSSIIP